MAGERIERAAYSARDLQQLYGVGKTKLYKEIATGRLIARRFGSRTIFLADDVARWVGGWPVVGEMPNMVPSMGRTLQRSPK